MTHTHDPGRTGRPPLAVWPCAPHAHQPDQPVQANDEPVLPIRLARRLITEYTHPGGVVADLTGTGVLAAQAEAQVRTCEVLTRTFTDRADQQVGGVAWADLSVVTTPAAPGRPHQVRERRLRARVLFAATVTRPGGIVAVVTGLDRTPQGALVDPAPGVVLAATCAGLVYLQHVVALTVPICETGLGGTPPVRDHGVDLAWGMEEVDVALPASAAEAVATITSPAHLNVSVFRLPRRGRTATAEARGEVDA